MIIVKLIKAVGELKKSRLTRLYDLKDILKFYKYSDGIVIFLENLVDHYRLFKSDPLYGDKEQEEYQLRSEYIWDQTVKALLEKKPDMPQIIEFEREYDNKVGK